MDCGRVPEDPDVNLNEVAGPEWIDDAGRRALDRLRAGESEAVIGHCDWLAGNLRWSGDALLVVHDWDSMTADSEAVLVGFAAALYSTVSADELATVEDTERFLVAYCHARGREFSADELERSWAAGVWTRAYDAKYQHAAGQPITSLSENEARERLRRTGTGRGGHKRPADSPQARPSASLMRSQWSASDPHSKASWLASAAGLAGGEPVALGAGLQDVGVEGDAVDDGGDEPGVGEHGSPLAERQIRPDGDGGSFLPFGDDLEQQLGASGIELNVAELVDLSGCPDRSTTSGCCPSPRTPPRASTGWSTPPTRNAPSRSDQICTRLPSTSSCPTPSPPRPSTGSCTTPTSARPPATPSGYPRHSPGRG